MRRVLFIAALFLFVPSAQAAETVVLLHGIAKTSSSMKPVEKALRAAGYEVLSMTYPSTKKNLTGIAEGLREAPLNQGFWDKAEKVHFVTHSMGGLVAQQYLNAYRDDLPAPKVGRVVMLAPPNGGSEEPYYDLGIIAGTKEWTYIVAAFVVPGASDGRVSVEKTKMAGMKDHITVPATHTFIMDRPDVHRQVLAFLKSGAFTRK